MRKCLVQNFNVQKVPSSIANGKGGLLYWSKDACVNVLFRTSTFRKCLAQCKRQRRAFALERRCMRKCLVQNFNIQKVPSSNANGKGGLLHRSKDVCSSVSSEA